MEERKQINFTIVPDDKGDVPRVYANFCAISHTPFDFTLSFCEVLPLSENDIQQAQANHVVRAPVRARRPPPLLIFVVVAPPLLSYPLLIGEELPSPVRRMSRSPSLS